MKGVSRPASIIELCGINFDKCRDMVNLFHEQRLGKIVVWTNTYQNLHFGKYVILLIMFIGSYWMDNQ